MTNELKDREKNKMSTLYIISSLHLITLTIIETNAGHNTTSCFIYMSHSKNEAVM